jgi:hypothetical protein
VDDFPAREDRTALVGICRFHALDFHAEESFGGKEFTGGRPALDGQRWHFSEWFVRCVIKVVGTVRCCKKINMKHLRPLRMGPVIRGGWLSYSEHLTSCDVFGGSENRAVSRAEALALA